MTARLSANKHSAGAFNERSPRGASAPYLTFYPPRFRPRRRGVNAERREARGAGDVECEGN